MMKMTLNEEIEYLQSGNWYDKVRAVLPTDEYLKLGWAIGDIVETLELFRSIAPEPQTNADHIRTMSDDELADFIDDWWCVGANGDESYATHEARLAWLQAPAEEDT